MRSQLESVTKSVNGESVTIGVVEMTLTVKNIGDEEFISRYHATMKVDDNFGTGVELGSYDSFEEAVEELHKAYDNHIGGVL